MPLQIRRGTEAERQSLASPLVSGELLWITDDFRLYIGDGNTLAKDLSPVTGYGDDNAKDAAAAIFTAGTHSGISFSYDGATAIDATVSYPALLQNLSLNSFDITGTGNITVSGTVTADAFRGDYKGSISADDSTILVDALNGSINLNGTVKGNITPNVTDSYDLGTSSDRFRSIYLSSTGLNVGSANITSTGFSINLPEGSTVGGLPIGTDELVRGTNHNINIIGDDSSVMVDSSSLTVTAVNGFFGDVTGNTFGVHIGDVQGSVFADDSTVLVNGVSGLIEGDVDNLEISTTQISANFLNNSMTLDSIGLTLSIDSITSAFGVPGISITSDLGPDSGGDLFRIFSHHNDPDASDVLFLRSKGTSAAPSALSAGDNIFNIRYIGRAINNDSQAAVIRVAVDPNGTVSSDVIPGKIEFQTNNNNGVLETKLSIDKDGVIDFFDNTTTAGSNPGEVDLATSTVAESWLRVKVGGVEYAVPLYAINP